MTFTLIKLTKVDPEACTHMANIDNFKDESTEGVQVILSLFWHFLQSYTEQESMRHCNPINSCNFEHFEPKEIEIFGFRIE